MKKNIKYSVVVLITFFLVACNDSFLETKPMAKGTTETFYDSFEALDYTATAAYGIMDTYYIFDVFYGILYQSLCDDVETGGENRNDWPQAQRIDQLIHTASETELDVMWGYPYKGIRMTNEVLIRIDMIKDIEIEKAGSEEKAKDVLDKIDQRAAEMHFLRAFYHFVLMQIYGGVPIVDYIMDAEQFNVPRNSVAEVLHFVENELLLAIPYLKEKSELLASDEVGRASIGAAKSLLAKAYLYESSYAENYPGDDRFTGCTNQYTNALKYAEEVITSNEYKLVGESGERFDSWRAPAGQQIGGFRWIFTLDADNCDESVWEVQNQQDKAGWAVTRGTYMMIYSAIRKIENRDGTPTGTDFGWSFNIPSTYMINAFGNNDRRDVYQTSCGGINSPTVDPTLDPRFATTVGREGDTVYIKYNGQNKWMKMGFSNIPAAAISRKYECSPDEFTYGSGDTYGEGPMNIRLIRYADVILMAAEAAFKTNDAPKALGYVNRVRTRARISGSTGYPENLTTLAFGDIVHERRLEFAMENQRVFDLVRWNIAYDFINGIELGGGLPAAPFVKGKHEFFPIPTVELQKAPGLVQYDGWK